jgi:hypothetical protein
MFISSTRSYYSASGEQRADGRFLMVFDHEGFKNAEGKPELRALVRRAEMHQCGHWMMATVKVKSEYAKADNDPPQPKYTCWFRRVFDGYFKITLSGSYGGDGLPQSADKYPGLWEQLHPLPESLQKEFWDGGGHNCAGAEGPSMQAWAEENLQTLTRLRKLDANPAQDVTDTPSI